MLAIAAYAVRPPLPLSIGTLIPLLVGAGWVAAPFVSSRKTAETIWRPARRAAYLAAVGATFAAGIWVYATSTGGRQADGASVVVYLLVPLLQAITLTIAGATAKAGEHPLHRRRPAAAPSTTTEAGKARDESDQEGR